MPLLRRLMHDERGATMVEYGLLVAAIAAMVMGAIYTMSTALGVKLGDVASCLTTRVCS